MIIWGIKLTKDKHEKAEYIDGIAAYDAGVVASVVLFLLSFILKFIPTSLKFIFQNSIIKYELWIRCHE
ncbi:hypothetical protein ACFFIX_24735 [Metabacillus herbersteinensis]|uniref:Uncharacterized protein n=1 Tax=Metabacillus herbersteinensis TaxID=283816 RepID=A0ABV6GM10_9BACI